ncbi:DNA-binding response OmpR family regulator [Variovorax boronicumulans]|nr:hypothetical protein [Variovorax boronicumulans]MDP9996496.1 DNA-binding response OmpR family regulator [Variovorax boronicumulans]MDQ0007806.1 DNA-binding response OmpR family regulator [Variovorax boronicumulans]
MNRSSEGRNFLRQRLSALGHFSVEFDCLEKLLVALKSNQEFDCLVISLQRNELLHSQLKNVLDVSISPFLFVINQDDFEILFEVSHLFLEAETIEVVPSACSDCELEFRLQLARRKAAPRAEDSTLIWKSYRFEEGAQIVWKGDEKLSLNRSEFKLAIEFFMNINCVVTWNRIHAIVYRNNHVDLKPKSLSACISKVREKLRLKPGGEFVLRSIYRRGYELSALDP